MAINCTGRPWTKTGPKRRAWSGWQHSGIPEYKDGEKAQLEKAVSSSFPASPQPDIDLVQDISRLHQNTMKSIFIVAAVSALAAAAPIEKRAPPNIPSTSSATSLLAGLTVKAQGSQDGYSRDLFPHWITQSGTCNTRETVLKRDGTNVVTNSACAATSGTWKSPYDGATWTAASDLDIDHVVPLSNAWKVR